MKFLYDLFPLILFFISYKLYDIYVATGVAIVSSFVQISAFWLYTKRFEKIQVVTLILLIVFGGLTILLRDPLFIKWKTTIVNWLLAAVFFLTQFGTKRTVFEMIGDSKVALPKHIWKSMNLHWAWFFTFIGALNIYVAFYYRPDLSEVVREEVWVNFKVFGVLGLTFVFLILQMILISRKLSNEDKAALEQKELE